MHLFYENGDIPNIFPISTNVCFYQVAEEFLCIIRTLFLGLWFCLVTENCVALKSDVSREWTRCFLGWSSQLQSYY